ncbi:MAG: sugar phosphate isomerase/epimerase [Clostridia bacterium]|nr:sugar phosphate isomerase/epimerase [Clostridia bacterium]
MELGINLNYLLKSAGNYSIEKTVEQAVYAKELGFTVLDYVSDIGREDWKERAERTHALFEENGIVVHQSHAPFNRYNKNRTLEEFKPLVARSIEAASILGSKYVVVHADEYRLAEGEEYDSAKVQDFIYDYLAPFVEQAKKCGVGIAIEDLFEDAGRNKPRSRYTSTVEELLGIIERFNDDAVTCCWDFGHAEVAYGVEEAFDAFKTLFPYISCTHVHDNYYNKDLHLLPFQGNLDWNAHMRYMRENNYGGNFTYEFVYGKMPPVLLHEYLLLAKKTADYLFSL